MRNIFEESLEFHKNMQGKITVDSKVPVNTVEDLSLAYTPGVAEPCRRIYQNPTAVYDYTAKGNLIAIVTDGSAVLGLGDLGAAASIPVMEGKAVLFKKFGNVDAFPICIASKDVDEIVRTVKLLEPVFGGINLEDISAPRCFEIEERLKKDLSIPVFHDGQHGTAIVVLAGLINALRLVKKEKEKLKILINGAGAAGIAIARLLLNYGFKNIILCDRLGAIYKNREKMDVMKEKIAGLTNEELRKGKLESVIEGMDVFIGVSASGVVSEEMISKMNEGPIVFALANPVPEIMPDLAKKAGARVIGTVRSDFPNQINNVLAFPSIFRGALNIRVREISDDMKIAAAQAIASLVKDHELREDYIRHFAG